MTAAVPRGRPRSRLARDKKGGGDINLLGSVCACPCVWAPNLSPTRESRGGPPTSDHRRTARGAQSSGLQSPNPLDLLPVVLRAPPLPRRTRHLLDQPKPKAKGTCYSGCRARGVPCLSLLHRFSSPKPTPLLLIGCDKSRQRQPPPVTRRSLARRHLLQLAQQVRCRVAKNVSPPRVQHSGAMQALQA